MDTKEDRTDAKSEELFKNEIYALKQKCFYAYFPDSATLSLQSASRSEGWHAKIKALTTPYMPLSLFARELNRWFSNFMAGGCRHLLAPVVKYLSSARPDSLQNIH